MIDLSNIHKHTRARPDFNFIGTGGAFDALPATHREQMVFLNEAAASYIFEFAHSAHLVTGGFWAPFQKGNFARVETFREFYDINTTTPLLKKWLYKRGIAFSTKVFVLFNYGQPPMLVTWKLLLKYAEHFFFRDDVMVFDSTLQWCLVYFHENQLFFGEKPIIDTTGDEQQAKQLYERKKKYPNFRHPFF